MQTRANMQQHPATKMCASKTIEVQWDSYPRSSISPLGSITAAAAAGAAAAAAAAAAPAAAAATAAAAAPQCR